jgi:propanol-preferring alcohol dehydrogenase
VGPSAERRAPEVVLKAIVLRGLGDVAAGRIPLDCDEWPDPTPAEDEVLVRVSACGVCHTELDEIDGRTPPTRWPIILGHQVVGRVAAVGKVVRGIGLGARVGVAWIHSACGTCRHCAAGDENLCPEFKATGRDADGGYAEYLTVPAAFAHAIPETFSDAEAAPLLCAGAVGYRALRLTGIADGEPLGLTGFGASGHLVLKLARHQYPRSPVFVWARNPEERTFARELGATWTGDTDERPPELARAIIDTTPAWRPVIRALQHLAPGGRLVINAIRKEAGDGEILARLDYARHLWLEKEIKSVANVTRRDVREFLALAAAIPIRPEVEEYELARAAEALLALRKQRVRGAKVLRIS